MTTAIESREPQGLGAYLATLRSSHGLSLRDVEAATEKRVSNAYLSQVENGKIARPSPNVLHALAEAYGVAYETLMEKAGYLAASTSPASGVLRSAGRKKAGKARPNAFAGHELTDKEEKQLLEYLAFIRSRQGDS